MFSAVSSASYAVGAWQKHVHSFCFLCGFWKASYRWHARRKSYVKSPTKRAISLTKTLFQLHIILIVCTFSSFVTFSEGRSGVLKYVPPSALNLGEHEVDKLTSTDIFLLCRYSPSPQFPSTCPQKNLSYSKGGG